MRIWLNDKALTSSGVLADRFSSRFLGMMGRRRFPEDYCLILTPCSSIHMAFMRIPLDVAYLDKSGTVLALQLDLQPWRIGQFHKGVHSVLEAPAGGVLRGFRPGDRVSW